MKMEELTKTQIILLTLLVSFVSSIATGIVTVTLMDQAPSDVVKVFSRVIEHKVELPAEVQEKKLPEASSLAKETVILKEEDLITDALAKNSKTLVRVNEINGDVSIFVGLAVIVHSDGTVVTDSSVLNSEKMYEGELFNGKKKLLSLVRYDPKEKTALLQFVRVAEDILAGDAERVSLRAVNFADASKFKIGQTVLTLSGSERDEAGIGILASMQHKEAGSGESVSAAVGSVKSQLLRIGTSIRTDGATGGPLLNIFGELMGVTVIGATNNPSYVPVNIIASQLAQFRAEGIAVRRNIAPVLSPGELAAPRSN